MLEATIKKKEEFEALFFRLKKNKENVPDVEQRYKEAYSALKKQVLEAAEQLMLVAVCDGDFLLEASTPSQRYHEYTGALLLWRWYFKEIAPMRNQFLIATYLFNRLDIKAFYYEIGIMKLTMDSIYYEEYWKPRCQFTGKRWESSLGQSWWDSEAKMWRDLQSNAPRPKLRWPPDQADYFASYLEALGGYTEAFGLNRATIERLMAEQEPVVEVIGFSSDDGEGEMKGGTTGTQLTLLT